MTINPLDIRNKGWRILSDRGIKQALDLGLIKITPALDYAADITRIQPATIDLMIQKITESRRLYGNLIWNDNDLILSAHSENEVMLTEKYEFLSGKVNPIRLIWPSIEARSTMRRIGSYVPNQGNFFFTNNEFSHVEINNYSCNDLLFAKGERIAQMFVGVDPFKDKYLWPEDKENIDKIKSLDMGLILDRDDHIEYLIKKGDLGISPKTKVYKSFLLVHAGDKAYRFRKIPGGFDFANRKKYSNNDLLEEVDISNGLDMRPGEHIIIETKESFKLSPKVGIRFWDNHINKIMNVMNKFGENPEDKALLSQFEDMIRDEQGVNILTDGWIDPGYVGGFSRQPKWNSVQHIKPGDVIGMGQVFYFPKGVENPYGSENLQSQYQNKKRIEFSK